MIQLVELGADEHCSEAKLRARMLESPKACHTLHYVGMENGSEVAFIALDQIPVSTISFCTEFTCSRNVAVEESVGFAEAPAAPGLHPSGFHP